PTRSPEAIALLAFLFQDDDSDVRAHAAVGLWELDGQHDDAAAQAILYGQTSDIARMALFRKPDFRDFLIRFLKDDVADVRVRAAELLGGWGLQSEVVPALVGLLADAHPDVRIRAA